VAVQRQLLDLLLDGLAWLVGHGLYRTVEVAGADRIPRDQPLVIVANHFNGLVDAVLLAVIVRGVPRFVAKGTLWRSWLLRPLLAVAGLVPVSRPEDRDGDAVDNATLFGSAHDILRRRGTLAIFPEGTTHDHLELQRVRTGAARIALGARDVGVEGVTIVPIGLTFDDKLALRSRVLARVGQPIRLDRWSQRWADRHDRDPASVSAERRDAVDALTETIRTRLLETTPRYDDPLDRAMLNRAADVRLRAGLRGPEQIVALAPRERLAQAIADAPADARRAVLDALGTYQVQLDLLRLRDEHLVPRVHATWLLRRVVGLAVYLAVLGIVVVAGVVVNVLPTLLTAMAGRRPAAPVTKGTVRVLTALAVFPLTWLVVAILAPVAGWLPTLAIFLACPVAGAVAVGGLERAIALGRAWLGWLGLRNARDLLERLADTRARVCEQVDIAAAQRF
jgi:glycerol-3-phosphate O-acyltransferase/dihydroxyacetone phosphate acyltransferase